jgi:diguanylate cyclase (GGDEF)-like protein
VAVAGALTGAVREVDMVARWGGEEFLLVLRDAAPAELPALTRRILAAVRGVGMVRPDGSELELTASLGWCEFPSFDLDASRWEEVLHLADIALYDAKASGRNNARGWLWNPEATATAIDAALQSREPPPAQVARLVVA